MNIEKIKNMSEKDLSGLNKESKVILFLLEIDNKNKDEIFNLYLKKYKLSKENFNERVIKRVFGVDYRYSKEKGEKILKVLKEELIRVKIDYIDIVKRKEKVLNLFKKGNKLKSNYWERNLNF